MGRPRRAARGYEFSPPRRWPRAPNTRHFSGCDQMWVKTEPSLSPGPAGPRRKGRRASIAPPATGRRWADRPWQKVLILAGSSPREASHARQVLGEGKANFRPWRAISPLGRSGPLLWAVWIVWTARGPPPLLGRSGGFTRAVWAVSTEQPSLPRRGSSTRLRRRNWIFDPSPLGQPQNCFRPPRKPRPTKREGGRPQISPLAANHPAARATPARAAGALVRPTLKAWCPHVHRRAKWIVILSAPSGRSPAFRLRVPSAGLDEQITPAGRVCSPPGCRRKSGIFPSKPRRKVCQVFFARDAGPSPTHRRERDEIDPSVFDFEQQIVEEKTGPGDPALRRAT